MRVLLIDPSLFTAPYDAALTRGLIAAGVEPYWWVRPLRAGDREEIPSGHVATEFYRHTDQLPWLPAPLRAAVKGLAHAYGLARLVLHVDRERPDVVHFQWTVLPVLDGLAMLALRGRTRLVLTVHDTQAFNGERISLLQNFAFDWPARLADRVIVHTRAGRERLLARGIEAAKIGVIPHGPLTLPGVSATPVVRNDPHTSVGAQPPLRFTLFGEIKPYKGADLLIEALGLLEEDERRRVRVVIAGRPRMDLTPLQTRMRALGVEDLVELRPRRLSEAEMAQLFAETDCFVFPYRQIDASGVYFLIKALAPWIIATRVGVFAEEMTDGVQGTLIPPEQPRALAEALRAFITQRPRAQRTTPGAAWVDIGKATRALYRAAHDRGVPAAEPRQGARAGLPQRSVARDLVEPEAKS